MVIETNGIEVFDHVKENRAFKPPFATAPGYSFNELGQLQECATSGSKLRLFVPQ